MKLTKYLILFSLLLAALACGQFSVEIEQPTATVDPIEAIVQATLTASAQESQTPAGLPLVNPAWLSDPEIPTGPALPAFLSGLSYRDDSVWLVDQAGVPHLVMGQPAQGELSPDGTGYLFSSSMDAGEDIYYFNMVSQTVSQWTDTPATYESGYRWWPTRPNVIVYNFVPEDQLGPWYGYLSARDITTGDQIVIDGQVGSGSAFALAPDGERIAYLQGTQPMIYTWGMGSVPIDMQALGLGFDSYSAPAWSPDSRQLAFHAAGGESDPTSGAVQNATVIVDLAANTAMVLHEYASYGRRAEPEIAWNPDGQWLAVVNPGEVDPNGDPMAMWVISADGATEIFLGFSSGPIWSPDGDYLIYTSWPPIGTSAAHTVNTIQPGVWEPTPIPQLEGSFLENWIRLP